MRRILVLCTVLATLALGVAACGGSKSSSDGGSGSAASAPTPTTDLSITAKNLKFDKKALSTPPAADVVLVFDNEDNGTLHNLAIYQSKDGKGKIFTGDLFASTDYGVLMLSRGGNAWSPAAPSLPAVAVYGLTIDADSRLLYAATHGRGIWRLKLEDSDDVTTGGQHD